MRNNFKFHLLLLPLLALGLAACGNDDDDNNNVAQAPAPASQASLANWQTMVAMSGCDFNMIRPLGPGSDLAHDMINDGNGISGANSVPTPGNASDAVPMPGNASDNANNGNNGNNGSSLNIAAFQCSGANAHTITINRSGNFSFANGQQGTLSQAEMDQINQHMNNLGNVAPSNATCETDANVSSNQITYVTTDNTARTYLFVGDDAGNRQCMVGTREQTLGLQQAVQKIVTDHVNASGSSNGSSNGGSR